MLFASYNIQYGTGRDGRVDLARIARAVEAADVIALQEVERFTQRTGMIDQPEAIGALLPRFHWTFGPGMDLDADVVAPGGAVTRRRRQFGNMLLSRSPILAARNHLLPKFGTLTQFSLQRCALEGVIAAPGGKHLRAVSVHLSHLSDGDRGPQVDALLDVHRRAPAEGGAWCGGNRDPSWLEGKPAVPMPREAVMMGDFNMTSASPLYERIVGPRSAEYGRMNNLEGFVDAWVAAGNREDSGVTCEAGTPPKPVRIDFCFASSALAGLVRRAWIDSEADGSDHQPIFTEIAL